MNVTIPYTPRKQQAFIHTELDKHRFSVLCCHRRFGKTVMLINHLIKSCMTNNNHQPRFAYIAPTYSQAKKIAWDYLKHYTKNLPNTKYNETELRADFFNGSRIQLLSSENPDSIRGIYLDGAVIDEASQVSRELVDEVIRPALSDRKGWLSLCSTPKGMNNIFYDLYQKAQSEKDWFLYIARASETKLVDDDELKAALSVMGQATYNQEFECSFIGNVKGSIYGELITKLENEKRIARVPHDPSYPVNTAWDLGYNDSTAILFYQNVGHAINVIDSYENSNKAFPHYAQILKEKDYSYGEHIGPHDLDQTDFATGRTRREVAYQLGLRFRIAPKLSIEDGIHAVKMLLPRCYIDVDNCKKFINALRHYHRKYKEKDRMYSAKPNHDWSSHFNDALRTLAVGMERSQLQNKIQFQKDYKYEFSI
jgi:phage terminase large subunit